MEFSVLVEAANPLEAAAEASDILRSAIHEAGGETPDWPGVPHEAWSVRLVSVRSDLVSEEESEDSEEDTEIAAEFQTALAAV